MAHSNFTKFIGLGLIFVGYYYFLGKLNLNQLTIFSFSLSAFFFVIADFCEYQKDQLLNKRTWKYSFWSYLHNGFQGLSALAIVLFPYFKPNWDDDFINKINNTSLLCGLGLTILLMGIKTDKKNFKFIMNIFDNFDKMVKSSVENLEQSAKNTEDVKKLIDKIMDKDDK